MGKVFLRRLDPSWWTENKCWMWDLPLGYVGKWVSSTRSVLAYVRFRKYIFRIFSLLHSKVTGKIWGSSTRSQCPRTEGHTSLLSDQNQCIVCDTNPINQQLFTFPTSCSFPPGTNWFKEKSFFLPFNILSCLGLWFKVWFCCSLLNWAEDYLMWRHSLLFWNCQYFLEQPFCTAANMPWILLLHITVILLCQGRIQPHRAGVSLCWPHATAQHVQIWEKPEGYSA